VTTDITLDGVTARLAAANIQVIAISVGPDELDSTNTTRFGNCSTSVPSKPQATALTNATGGVFYSGITPATIVGAIIRSVKITTCGGENQCGMPRLRCCSLAS